MSADEKAVDVALEIAKQIISISTAILALTGVFFEKLDGMTSYQRTLLATTWYVFFLAVLLGLVAFMISAGALAGKTGLAVVRRWDLRLVSALQIVAFFAAVLMMLIFARSRLSSATKKPLCAGPRCSYSLALRLRVTAEPKLSI
jgi:hypothetical protein